MKPRVTVSVLPDGSFSIAVNEAGRDLLIEELEGLSREWDHFHLDHYDDPAIASATDVPLANRAYAPGDQVLKNGKVLFRPDDWDATYFPHVLNECGGS